MMLKVRMDLMTYAIIEGPRSACAHAKSNQGLFYPSICFTVDSDTWIGNEDPAQIA